MQTMAIRSDSQKKALYFNLQEENTSILNFYSHLGLVYERKLVFHINILSVLPPALISEDVYRITPGRY
jgi:hypothetical protein